MIKTDITSRRWVNAVSHPNMMRKEHSIISVDISVTYAWIASHHEETLDRPRLKVMLKNEKPVLSQTM